MKAPWSGRAGRRSRRAARRMPAMPRPSRTAMLVAAPEDAMREGGGGSSYLRGRERIRWLGSWSRLGRVLRETHGSWSRLGRVEEERRREIEEQEA
jgi:hypothetical protein